AGFHAAQDGELHARDVQQLGDGLGGLLGAVLQGTGATDPEQVLGVLGHLVVDDRDLDRVFLLGQLLDPVHAPVLGHTPGVGLVLQVFQERVGLGGEVGLDHDLVAAHVQDVVDVLDVDRALLHAGTTVGARPQFVGVDDPTFFLGAHQRPVERGQHVHAGVAVVGLFGQGLFGDALQQVRGL